MSNPRISEDDLAAYACGELDAAARAEVEAAMAADPALAAEAARLTRALEAATADAGDLPSSDFNARLRARLEAERQAAPARPPRQLFGGRRWPRLFLRAAAAAAVLALAVLAATQLLPTRESGVAWADVVKAMNKAPFFTITAYEEDDSRRVKVELFYRQPDLWRTQAVMEGYGGDARQREAYVQFLHGAEGKTFDVQARRFTDDSKHSFFKPEFAAKIREQGILEAMLAFMFHGEAPPAGEPVKTGDGALGADVEVFDYAKDSRDQWVRVWVLKSSRLPIRAKAVRPAFNDTMVMEFDYSDPQPEKFFDAEAFAKAVKETQPQQIEAFLRIGQEPVGTKPRGSDQVYAAQGGYKAPKIIAVTTNDLGDVKVVTTLVDNRLTPAPGDLILQENYRLEDNWGNRYLLFHQTGGVLGAPGATSEWGFTPVPPMKNRAGPQQFTFVYWLDRRSKQQNAMNSEEKELARETVAAPPPTVTGELEFRWGTPQEIIQSKRLAVAGYWQQCGTLRQQLAVVDQQLAADPKDVDANLWKVDLLLEHGRTEQAWKLFEDRALETVLADPARLVSRWRWINTMDRYLQRLLDGGRGAEVGPIVEKLEAARKETIESKDRNIQERAKSFFREDMAPAMWLKLPQALRDFEAAPKPKLVRAVRSKDGYLLVQVELPGSGSGPASWNRWSPSFEDPEGWTRVNLLSGSQAPAQLMTWTFMGSGEKLVLAFNPMMVPFQNGGSNSGLRMRWQLPVVVPEAGAASLKDYITANLPDLKWKGDVPTPFETMNLEADRAMKSGQPAKAAELYRKLIDTPDADWPAWYREAFQVHQGLVIEQTRLFFRTQVAKALVAQDKLDEARALLAEAAKRLPEKVNLEDNTELRRRQTVRSAQLEFVRRALSEKRLAEAAALLDEIERTRPDLADIPDRTVFEQFAGGGGGGSMWNLRSEWRRSWDEFDTVRWDLLDAQGHPAPKPETGKQ